MLRVGLTGQLGSGKSTVAAMLAARGAVALSADEIGRRLMQPGEAVFGQIVADFGPGVVSRDGSLDRAGLARIAFEQGGLERLNAIVHPAVIAAQEDAMERIEKRTPDAIVVVESALIFEVERDARLRGAVADEVLLDWRNRFDRIVLVTAPDEVKIERFVMRQTAGKQVSEHIREQTAADARKRMATQIADSEKVARVSNVVRNDGDLAALRSSVDALFDLLCAVSRSRTLPSSTAGR